MEYVSPGSALFFRFDASEWLASSETVDTFTWTVETGLTLSDQTDGSDFSDAKITADSAYLGKTLEVTVEATTNKPNTFKRNWFVKVQDQQA